MRGVSGGPFIAWRGRFPGEKRAGTLVTDVGMAVETFLPKLRGSGARPGSAEPEVPPTPHCRLWPPSFAGSLVGGPSSVYVSAEASFVGLLCLVGPLCRCDAGLDILCTCVASFAHFIFISRLGACNSRITKIMEMVRDKPYSYVR